jgi:Tfp pilus assembly protein FimT
MTASIMRPIAVPPTCVASGSSCAGRDSRRGGYLLVEYMIYIAVLAVVMGLAFGAFYRSLDNSRDLNRSTEDILRVLAAGEQWRADVRRAQTPPKLITEGPMTTCEISTADGLVVYLFSQESVWRKESEQAPRQILPRVARSSMIQDQSPRVTSWRWELELKTRRKQVRMRPLFTFEAVLPVQPR